MTKFQRSWALFKCSLQVVGSNPKLLLFPVVVFLLMCLIGVFFLVPIALWDTGHAWSDAAHWQSVAHRWISWDAEGENVQVNYAGYALLAALYLVSTFLATFFNVAFYSQILEALRGRPVSVAAGLRLASARLKPILAWSLFTGLVGLVIKWLEERVGLVGRWIVGLIGLAWSAASVFVVPIIVVETEGANPVELLKASAAMLRKTWGEALIGYLGLRVGGLLVLAGSVVLFTGTIWTSVVLENLWILGGVAFAWILCLFAFMYLVNVAGQVYLGALYVYASEGAAPAPFDREQMDLAWKVKSGGT